MPIYNASVVYKPNCYWPLFLLQSYPFKHREVDVEIYWNDPYEENNCKAELHGCPLADDRIEEPHAYDSGKCENNWGQTYTIDKIPCFHKHWVCLLFRKTAIKEAKTWRGLYGSNIPEFLIMLTQGEMSGCPFVVVFILEITSIPFVWGQIKNEAVYHLAAATLSKMEKVVDYV